ACAGQLSAGVSSASGRQMVVEKHHARAKTTSILNLPGQPPSRTRPQRAVLERLTNMTFGRQLWPWPCISMAGNHTYASLPMCGNVPHEHGAHSYFPGVLVPVRRNHGPTEGMK